jgi:hypothetical protein
MLGNQKLSMNFIEHLMYATTASAHIKDISNGKYLDSNEINLKKFGMTKPSDIIGLTIHDIGSIMTDYWSKQMVKEIAKIDNRVVLNQFPMTDNRAFLSFNGRVIVHDMFKIPIINHQGQVIAIYTSSNDVTPQVGLVKLYHLYLKLYTELQLKPHVAIQKYIEHINMSNYLFTVPTKSEINVLIHKIIYHYNKKIAHNLNISVRTVESHLKHLQEKVNIDLTELVEKIKILE